jgi:phosphohistidine phosphatase
MPHLELLRHAKSSWDDPGLSDRDRPLSPRGRRAAKRVAEHIRAEGIRPELVLCSPAIRARQTLARVRRALGDPKVSFDEVLYAADAEVLLGRLRAVPAGTGTVLVVGHNPGLQDLALELASSGAALGRLRKKLPTCALVSLTFEGAWSDLGAGSAELVGFLVPRDLP